MAPTKAENLTLFDFPKSDGRALYVDRDGRAPRLPTGSLAVVAWAHDSDSTWEDLGIEGEVTYSRPTSEDGEDDARPWRALPLRDKSDRGSWYRAAKGATPEEADAAFRGLSDLWRGDTAPHYVSVVIYARIHGAVREVGRSGLGACVLRTHPSETLTGDAREVAWDCDLFAEALDEASGWAKENLPDTATRATIRGLATLAK